MEVVGSYETVRIVRCDSCEIDSVVPCSLVKPGGEWVTDFFGALPWVCQWCKEESSSPSSYHGKKFVCPSCTFENVQALEPRCVERDGDGNKYFVYASDEITCMYCEAVFGFCVVPDGEVWKYSLYRKDHE